MNTKNIEIQKKYINHWCNRHFRSVGATQFFKSKTNWVASNHQLRFTPKALPARHLRHRWEENTNSSATQFHLSRLFPKPKRPLLWGGSGFRCGKYQTPLGYHFGIAQKDTVRHGAQRPDKNLQVDSVSHRKQLPQYLQRNTKGRLFFRFPQPTDSRGKQNTCRIKRFNINRQKQPILNFQPLVQPLVTSFCLFFCATIFIEVVVFFLLAQKKIQPPKTKIICFQTIFLLTMCREQ